ncbi:MAG: GyrI-like domain-containing protein [Candidatus Eisenbacteria bacterium]|uniref:GyrI-like domain-containing protein n=1 Tax=Eiseniibacteriota bacterium TaxID=2212470 RepID=A0A933SB29_UNCEI|nr:GyrI-like domain-containing protein [Candidatus Eisenbacteria bacterium]
MIDEPQILHTTAQPIAVVRLTVPRSEIREVMGPAIGEVRGVLAEQGVAPAGPWFTRHLRLDPDVFDLEVGVPVWSTFDESGRVVASMLPAVKLARTIYQGPYEGLAEAWSEFEEWIAAEGHECGAGLWECYVAGPESGPDPAAWRTELNRALVQ